MLARRMIPTFLFLAVAVACSDEQTVPLSLQSPTATPLRKPEPGGWQYAWFGMTAAQVVEASQGKAHIPKEREPDVIAVGDYATGAFIFEVAFLSLDGSGKLSAVKLTLRDGYQFPALKASLVRRYGAGDCHESAGNGSFGAPEDLEHCFWRSEEHSIQLKYSYTHIVGWAPTVELYYSGHAEGGL